MSASAPGTAPAPTRAAGLERLAAFVPRAGRDYAETRNEDRGPAARDNVSSLSPWLRHRLVTEEEVLHGVLAMHTRASAGSFIQEVFWRGYFKGHLETHHSIWSDYRSAVDILWAAAQGDRTMTEALARAVEGRTGIDCFDDWVQELRGTGYLHNHARMWFASIWIFTLKLPWQLGADFSYRHFLDGDPAANTLSWRWVAGLHTRGKHYLARAENITRYTAGRYAPRGLIEDAAPLQEASRPPLQPLPEAASAAPAGRVALLLTEEDLHPESLGLDADQLAGIAGVSAIDGRSPLPVSQAVRTFMGGALDDALGRAVRHFGCPAQRLGDFEPEAVLAWARGCRARWLLSAYLPVGPARERWERLVVVAGADAGAGVVPLMLRRDYDSRVWPHAGRGFFELKKKIDLLI